MEIKDRPDIILNRLEEAIQANYKKEIVEAQQQYSYGLLLKAMNHYFNKNDMGEDKYEQRQ